MKENTVLSIKY